MSAVVMRLSAEFRARRRAWLGLALLVALFFGPALGAFAGARRTNSVYSRFLVTQHAWDVFVQDASIFAPILWKPDYAAIEKLPYIASSVRFVTGNYLGVTYAGDVDGRYGTVINKPKILEGRLPRPDRPEEIAVSVFQPTQDSDAVVAADKRALATARVGQTLALKLPCHVQPRAPGCVGNPPVATRSLTVVGRIVSPFDFPPNEFDAFGIVSPAFVRHPPNIDFSGAGFRTTAIAIRLRHRSDLERFDRDLGAMTKGKAVVPIRAQANTRAIEASARLQGMAVGLLALFAGLTAILLMAQTLGRQTVLESNEYPTLQALGMSRKQTFALGVVRAAGIATTGATLAGLVAWRASELFPFGIFRLAEPNPGARFDAIPMVLAPLGIVGVAIAAVAIPSWRSASARRDVVSASASRTAHTMAVSGASPATVAGVRLALERGRGRTAVPVRSTITIVTLGIAATVAAITVSQSISHLLGTPLLYGKSWDKVVNFEDGKDISGGVAKTLADQPEISALAAIDTGAPFTVDGHRVGGVMLRNFKGSLFPPVIEGRAPEHPDEILLGTKTLRAIGKRVDLVHPQTVRIGIEGLRRTLDNIKIVGRAAVPPVSNDSRFGEGLVAADLPLQNIIEATDTTPPPTDMIVRFVRGSDSAAVIARTAQRFPGLQVGNEFARRPSEVVDFGRVRGMPLILSGILGVIAALSLAHAVVSAVRRRRRDLAILKTIGFVRAQVRHTVAWQSSTLVVLAVVLGIPIGLLGGHAIWNAIADAVGVVPQVRVPTLMLILVPPAALVLANAVAVLPGRSAAQTMPASVLRAE